MIEGRDMTGGPVKLRYGLVGGGPGSFIATVHRMSIAMTGAAELAAGCFSRDYEKTKATAAELGIAEDRAYRTFAEMADAEAKRPDKIDFVVIATPNNTHYEAAKAFLEKGFHVSCDKPLVFTVDQAMDLVKTARAAKREFMVTYVYTGYPMVRQAREMVKAGELGELRVVMAEYPQDWLSEKLEDTGAKQAVWRTDPKSAGASCCVGDIGTHIENLVHFVTGLEIESLAAQLDTFVEGRPLDDNAFIWLKYKGGARGNYWPSQVAIGRENGLKFRVYGTKGALEWEQENPNVLKFAPKGEPVRLLTRGNGYLGDHAKRWTRMPSGHPEGLFEAWATIYEAFCNTIRNHAAGAEQHPFEIYPTVVDGARGVKFVNDCVKSSREGAAWIDGSFSE